MSSGEAEFYAGTSAIARAIGLQQMLSDWGVTVSISLGMDATAGISMASSQGLGRAKHIHVQYLWAQDVLPRYNITLHKVKGTRNRADMFTKHLARSTFEGLQTRLGYLWTAGKQDPRRRIDCLGLGTPRTPKVTCHSCVQNGSICPCRTPRLKRRQRRVDGDYVASRGRSR